MLRSDKIIYVDMDDTLNEMLEHFFRVGYALGLLESENPTVMPTWDLTDYFSNMSNPKEREWAVNVIFRSPGFWVDIPVKEYAQRAMQKLNTFFQVYIATTPWQNYTGCISEKIEWMRQYFPLIPRERIIFIKDKPLLRGDLIIDDKPSHVIGFKGYGILMDMPYNREVEESSRIFRVLNWREVIETVQALELH